MRLRARIDRLRYQVVPAGPPTDEECLAKLCTPEARHHFAAEPDFPAALAHLQQALDQARSDSRFYPPPTYEPEAPSAQRLHEWRTAHPFPALDEAWEWIAELDERVRLGVPPVRESEFTALTVWAESNAARLEALAQDGPLVLRDGRSVGVGYLRFCLARGVRCRGAGRLAEDVRDLQQQVGVMQENV